MIGRFCLLTLSIFFFPTLFCLWVIPQNGILQSKNRIVSFEFNKRTYRLHVPSSYTGEAMPLVIALHGRGMPAWLMELNSGWSKKADKERFIVAYPDGVKDINGGQQSFNAGFCCGSAMEEGHNDTGFINTVIADISKDYSIDTRRIYITGFSNGAMLAYKYAEEQTDILAAAGIVSGSIALQDTISNIPSPKNSLPIIIMHGKNDETIPYIGGRGKNNSVPFASFQDAVNFWVTNNRCEPTPKQDLLNGVVFTKDIYTNCQNDADVVAITINDGTHAWVGGLQEAYKNLTISNIKATDEIWSFFAKQSRK
jgi:polyhydroxybutyrate depolymerase